MRERFDVLLFTCREVEAEAVVGLGVSVVVEGDVELGFLGYVDGDGEVAKPDDRVRDEGVPAACYRCWG